MRKLLTLWGREVKSYFYSPIGYVVLFFFLFTTGAAFWWAISLVNQNPTEMTVIEVFFNFVPFWIVFLVTFPLITMRVFSEEFKLGTIETLMTAPVRGWQVVLSKYLGALFFYIILWLPSLLYFWAFQWITGSEAAQAGGAYLGSYLLLLLLGMFYLAVGVLASALTTNQIIAAVISFCTITFLLFTGLWASSRLATTSILRDVVGYFSTIEHMMEFSKGMIDSRPIVYYLSMTVLLLVLTYHVFQYRKWKV